MPSLIEGYNYDIFISYRQKDNKHDGWVTEFVNNLKGELESTFKEDISIYFDENPSDGLLETHSVDKSLEGKLKCLIFIPIISQTYCDPKSFAWQYEFCSFNKWAKEDKFGRDIKLSSGNVASRIIPVQIHDLDQDDKRLIENELGGFIRGIEFIYKEPGVNRPLTPKDNEERNLNKTNYRNQINKTANAVKEIISALKKQYQNPVEDVYQRVEPTNSPLKNQRKGIIAGSLIILSLIIFGVVYVPKYLRLSGQSEKSIAVLPFRNLSSDTSQLYFCDGFMEELLNNLQKVEGFSVRSRTSSDQYRNTKKSVPTIGNELNVNYLVEGSVGREGNKLKIWVQLIDTKADKHLWSNEYLKELTMEQIFSVMSEIAQSIATELKTILSPEVIENIKKKPTENLEAYNLYLQGNYYYWKSYNSQDWDAAINFYLNATEIDPGFSLAYTKLAMSYLQQYWFYHHRGQEILQTSKKFIDKAFETDPELPEAHLALGVYYYNGFLDYQKAVEQLEIVLRMQPGNVEAWYYLGCVYRRAGGFNKSKSCLVKACELDPKSARILFNTGQTFDLMREYKEALKYFYLSLSISPDWTYPYRDLAFLYIKIDGDLTKSKELLNNEIIRNKDFLKDSLIVEGRVLLSTYEGRYDEALKELFQCGTAIFENQWYIRPKSMYFAYIYGLMKNKDYEHAYYDSTRIILEKEIISYPEDQRYYSALGIVYAGLGLEEKAIDMNEKALSILPVSKEAWKGAYLVENFAYTYVLLGKYQEALKQLNYLLSMPGPLGPEVIKLDPRWVPLRGQPGFKEMLSKYSIN